MLISRGLTVFRTSNLFRNFNKFDNVGVRNSHAPFRYRDNPEPPSKGILRTANIIGGFAWWWVLYHIWTDYERVTGEFDYPDACKWTDDELGIPPKSPKEDQSERAPTCF